MNPPQNQNWRFNVPYILNLAYGINNSIVAIKLDYTEVAIMFSTAEINKIQPQIK